MNKNNSKHHYVVTFHIITDLEDLDSFFPSLQIIYPHRNRDFSEIKLDGCLGVTEVKLPSNDYLFSDKLYEAVRTHAEELLANHEIEELNADKIRHEQLHAAIDPLLRTYEIICSVRGKEQEIFDLLPESLQQSEHEVEIENRLSTLEDICTSLLNLYYAIIYDEL